MPRLLLFAPCQLALIDSSSNLLSLISVVEGLGIPTFPGSIPAVSVTTVWQRNDEEAGIAMIQKVEMVGPDGQPVIALETPFLFANIGHRVINNVGGIPINAPGRYEFRLFVKPQAAATYPEQPVASYPILVQNVPSAQLNLGLQGPAA